MFLAGIDEAGYGPLLGPLTVGYSCFRVPDPELDLWEALAEVAARKPARGDKRTLRVDDSKRVNTGRLGRERMERTVLAFRELDWPLPHGRAQDLQSWVDQPPAGRSACFHRVPWLRALEVPLSPAIDPDRGRLDAARLRRGLTRAGASCAGIGARAVPAGEWNELTARHGGKGGAHFEVVMEVVRELLRSTAGAPLRIEIDRHGARMRYGDPLMRALRPERIEVHHESPPVSIYSLTEGGREVQIRFQEAAEDDHFPVALASLAAKLTRERLMDCFNAWFSERIPDLRPTKGYAQDGRRWLIDAEDGLGALEIDRALLVRDR